MPRIKIRNTVHDGSNRRNKLWIIFADISLMVYKMLDTKDFFIIIVDNLNMEIALRGENRDKFKTNGFEVITPAEYEASRTVVVRGVDIHISNFDADEILTMIRAHPSQTDFKIDKIIKIPNIHWLLKVVCSDVLSADRIVSKGLYISRQFFPSEQVQKEKFVNVRVCMRCYSFDHLTKRCTRNSEYKVCSECSAVGHRFNQCESNVKKCLNCGEGHRTLAMKCPARKKKIKELDEKKKVQKTTPAESRESDVLINVIKRHFDKLPENFAVVVTSALVLAQMKENERPGCYNFVVNEMFRANKIPNILIPASVINITASTDMEVDRSKKRQRDDDNTEEEEEGAAGGISKKSHSKESSIHWSEFGPAPSTISDLDVASDRGSMTAPTPFSSPTKPSSSTQVDSTRTKTQADKQPMRKKRTDPLVTLLAPDNLSFTDIAEYELYEELKSKRYIKYIYQNSAFSKEEVKTMVFKKQLRLVKEDIRYINIDRFMRVTSGGYLKMD